MAGKSNVRYRSFRRDERLWRGHAWLVCALICGGIVTADAFGQERLVVRGNHAWGIACLRDIGKVFAKSANDPHLSLDIDWGPLPLSVKRFVTPMVAEHEWKGLTQPASQPAATAGRKRYLIGQAKVAVIVNPANSLRMLTIPQIRHLLSAKGDGTRWQELNGSGGTIECYGLKGQDASRYVLRQACMMLGPKYPTGYLNFRKDLHELDSVDEVASKIRADRNGVGFVLYNGQDLRGVKLVPIAADAKSQAVLPGEGEIIVEDYPLADMLVLNLKPGGDEAAKVFCRFCIGEKGAEIVASLGFVPPLHHAHIVGQKRVSEMKAGRGVRLSVMGTGDGRDAFQGLAMEYVRAKAVVQLSYAAVDSDVFSIGVFVNGEGASVRELLVLGDKPSSRAMELHGETWNSLGVDRDGKPDGTGPKEHMIAGRAAAIIVNPANKIESLTLGQIQAIFQGDVDDWAIVGGTELTPPTGPGGGSAALTAGRPGTLDIHAFGLYAREPATAIFEKEAVPRNKWKQVKYKKDTAEAVAAVSMDPQAIAFVDLTAIPASGQSVKILPIKFGQGEKARNIAPTAENIRSAMYPLSQRYFLYVHPKASDTAKDFARFIATCGGSEAMPYADTVKAMMETYQKHGLIPLADEAITRAAKDAMAEAARSTSSGQARSASSGQARSASSGQARSASSGQAAKTKAEEAAKGKAALR